MRGQTSCVCAMRQTAVSRVSEITAVAEREDQTTV